MNNDTHIRSRDVKISLYKEYGYGSYLQDWSMSVISPKSESGVTIGTVTKALSFRHERVEEEKLIELLINTYMAKSSFNIF
jgi:hypothetical protein